MNVHDLAQRIDARIYPSTGSQGQDVQRVYAADTMSDLIAHAAPGTLLTTSLNNNQLVRVAELMDVPGICLTGGVEPSADLILRAAAAGTSLLVSPHRLEQTFKLLGDVLAGPGDGRR
jgi:hypothetical protein